MNREITLGSLFDGISGFPLAGQLAGIKTLWTSDVEPFPVRVSEVRFPDAQQLGDVCKINGKEIPPVDIITWGSPCQDLSIGSPTHEGLHGSRSSLFFEAVRIAKEMLEATNGEYPKWCVWENVTGAFSSNKGEDFRQVLESLCQITGRDVHIPGPAKGKWNKAGTILGDGYSLAWRTLDAAGGWGVPQRRRRIFAVLDTGGQRAGKVLFKSEGLSGYSSEMWRTRENTAGTLADSIGAESITAGQGSREESRVKLCLNDQGGQRINVTEDCTSTLRAQTHKHLPIVYENHAHDTRLKELDGSAPPVTTTYGTGGNSKPLVVDEEQENVSNASLRLSNKQVYGVSAYRSNAMMSDNPYSGVYETEESRTVNAGDNSPACHQGGNMVVETYSLQGNMIGRQQKNGPQGSGINEEVSFTLNTVDRHAVVKPSIYSATHSSKQCEFKDRDEISTLCATDCKNPPIVSQAKCQYTVRMLTPLECCRLQGYPDWWCRGLADENPTENEVNKWIDIFNHWYEMNGRITRATPKSVKRFFSRPNTDNAEYRAYGNSVAVPCVFFVLAGIVWAEENTDNTQLKSDK